jgi:hypothetical protein
MTMLPAADTRSGFDQQNLGALMAATARIRTLKQVGQAQYSTPAPWARLFAAALPAPPPVVFDPQCAAGNLLLDFPLDTARYGVELDERLADQLDLAHGVRLQQRLTANCVDVWRILDELFPAFRLPCQVANPPFGIAWKLPDGNAADSTAHTWDRLLARTAPGGFGYLIASRTTLEKLGCHTHPFTYLYQVIPPGMFPGVGVSIGVVHWHKSPKRFRPGPARDSLVLDYASADPEEHRWEIESIRRWYSARPDSLGELYRGPDWRDEARKVFRLTADLLREERLGVPPFNLWLTPAGTLRLHFSQRTRLQRNLEPAEIERLARLDGCHPLALTPDTESRRLLERLLADGFTVEPAARTAIEAAIESVASLARPIMPVTDFEAVAYADDLEHLTVRADFTGSVLPAPGSPLHFTPGDRYAITTASYVFREQLQRTKAHWTEEEGMHTLVHHCELSGTDRYVSVTDDGGQEHRFMDRPSPPPDPTAKPRPPARKHQEHHESLLWQIFDRPNVPTVAERHPEQLAANRARLLALAATVKL